MMRIEANGKGKGREEKGSDRIGKGRRARKSKETNGKGKGQEEKKCREVQGVEEKGTEGEREGNRMEEKGRERGR